jgi:hypothetical protein
MTDRVVDVPLECAEHKGVGVVRGVTHWASAPANGRRQAKIDSLREEEVVEVAQAIAIYLKRSPAKPGQNTSR